MLKYIHDIDYNKNGMDFVTVDYLLFVMLEGSIICRLSGKLSECIIEYKGMFGATKFKILDPSICLLLTVKEMESNGIHY